MRTMLIAALLAAQAAPGASAARAAELAPESQARETRMGAFAGARVRLSLGGERKSLRAGLTAAPALHSLRDGAARMRIGEGLEIASRDLRRPGVTVAGRSFTEAAGIPRAPDGRRQNVSTTGWIAIGAGVVLLGGVLVLGWLVHEANENTE
jgi:hypothetical protein